MTVEFNLDGCTVTFDQERISYNQIRLKWQAMAQSVTDEFRRDYRSMDKCRLDLPLGIYQLGWLRLQDALAKSEQILRETPMELAPARVAGCWLDNYFDWDRGVAEICHQDRDSQDRQLGGLRPAAASADRWPSDLLAPTNVQAELTPAGLANRVRLFSSSSLQESLAQAFFRNAFSIHLAMMDLLKREGESRFRAVDAAEAASAQAIHVAILAGRVSKYRLAAACCEMLTLDPYSPDYYWDYLAFVGDQRNELERMAEYCGVSGIRAQKQSLLRVRAEAASGCRDRAGLARELRQLIAQCALLGINPDNPRVAMLEEKIAELDDPVRSSDHQPSERTLTSPR